MCHNFWHSSWLSSAQGLAKFERRTRAFQHVIILLRLPPQYSRLHHDKNWPQSCDISLRNFRCSTIAGYACLTRHTLKGPGICVQTTRSWVPYEKFIWSFQNVVRNLCSLSPCSHRNHIYVTQFSQISLLWPCWHWSRLECIADTERFSKRVSFRYVIKQKIRHGILKTKYVSLVASSPLFDSILVEIKCINVRSNTTVFSNCWRNQLHVSALLWVGHHQVEVRMSEKSHILQCGHQERGNEISFYNVWGGAKLYTRDVESALVCSSSYNQKELFQFPEDRKMCTWN
jgi:hypothetical protein